MSKLRGQDVLLVAQLLNHPAPWSYQSLGASIGISASQCHAAFQRLADAKVVDRDRRTPIRSNLLEFLRHGVKYMFPVTPGREAVGVPTAHSAPIWKNRLVTPSGKDLVWEHHEGPAHGGTIKPLYKTVPSVAMRYPDTYSILGIIDSIRLGRARETREAEQMLEGLIYGRG